MPPPDLITFDAPCDLQAADASKPARVSIVAYNGGIMTVPDFGPTVIDLAGLQAAPSVTLLRDHDPARVLGSAQAIITARNVILEGNISRRSAHGAEVIALAADAVQWQASVGVSVSRHERLQGGVKFALNSQTLIAPAGGLFVIRAGLLRETTITALGADANTSVAISAMQQVLNMFGFRKTNDDNAAPGTTNDAHDVQTQERERVAKIESTCRGDFGDLAGRVAELKAQAQNGAISIETLQAGVLECLRSCRTSAPRAHQQHGRSFSPSPLHLQAGILIANGMAEQAVKALGETIVSQAHDLRLKTFQDVLRAALMLEGKEPPRDAYDLLRASNSTIAMPTALGPGIEKLVGIQFEEAPHNTWRAFAAVRSVENFHPHTAISPEHRGDLERVPAGGELKHGSLSEDLISGLSVDTFGQLIGIPRKSLINDGLGILQDMTLPLANKAARSLADLVYQVLLSNAGDFFHEDHANLIDGGDSELSIDALQVMVEKLRKQTDAEGNALAIPPRTLLVPPELEVPARAILNSVELSRDANEDRLPTGNPLRGIAHLVVEPRLSNDASAKFSDAASPTAFYLFGPPASAPLFVLFLDGRQTPVIEMDPQPFDRLGLQWRVYHDFGAALGEFRSAVLSAGA